MKKDKDQKKPHRSKEIERIRQTRIVLSNEEDFRKEEKKYTTLKWNRMIWRLKV